MVPVATARQIISVPASNATKGIQNAIRSVNREWQQSPIAKIDYPETHTITGGTALAFRNTDVAIRAFQEATSLDRNWRRSAEAGTIAYGERKPRSSRIHIAKHNTTHP